MTRNAPRHRSLAVNALAKVAYILVALILTFVLFALLPLVDTIGQESRPPLRLVGAKVVVPPRPDPVAPPVTTQHQPSQKMREPRRLKPKSPSSKKVRAFAPSRLDALPTSLPLPMNTLQPGLGDVSVDFTIVTPPAPPPTPVYSKPSPPRVSRPKPTPKKPLLVRDLDARPRLLVPARPRYPLQAKQSGIEGYVDIEFEIEANGEVNTVRVLQAEPPGVFDESACGAARRWRFSVPLKDGKAVKVLARQRIQFRLEK